MHDYICEDRILRFLLHTGGRYPDYFRRLATAYDSPSKAALLIRQILRSDAQARRLWVAAWPLSAAGLDLEVVSHNIACCARLAVEQVDSAVRTPPPSSIPVQPRRGFPRLWGLLGYALPRTLRERVYEPFHEDILADYLEARRYRTKWARRWLAFCFALRTMLTFLECVRVGVLDRIARLLPTPLRRWWMT